MLATPTRRSENRPPTIPYEPDAVLRLSTVLPTRSDVKSIQKSARQTVIGEDNQEDKKTRGSGTMRRNMMA